MKKFLLFAAVASSMIAAQVLAQEPPTVSTAELSMRYCDAPVEEHIYQKIDINTTYQWEGDVYSETGNYTKVLLDERGCDRIVTLHLTVRTNPTGSIDGLFSVSPTEQVYFSKGNLKYASTDIVNGPWFFSENQWVSGGSYQFGTSGYTYSPTGSGQSNFLKFESLTKTEHDWGWHNAIKNGGNVPYKWYTMTYQQFNYLLNTRDGSLKRTGNEVHGAYGMILLPDAWQWSNVIVNGVAMTDWPSTTIDDDTWAAMEDMGAVFFPNGTYWTGTDPGSHPLNNSSTSSSNGWAIYFDINNSSCSFVTNKELNFYVDDNRQVRLVLDKQ